MGIYLGINGRALDLETGLYVDEFVPGVTQPFYVETVDFSGARNVGTNPTIPLTPYSGTPTVDGIVQITDGALYENVLFSHPTEVRSQATFKNCRWVIPASWTYAKPFAVVMILNGATADNIVFEDCEIHNRAQRAMNGVQGRNFVMRRSVITGTIDPWSESSSGSAPLTTRGFEVYDSIAPSLAYWYSNPANSEIHSDVGSHSDAYQSNTTLQVLLDNTVLAAYVSDFVGTGTPGSGNDAGNPYSPPSGTDYTASQAQMEAWRNTYTVLTTASQTMGGVQRRLQLNGSQAGVMLNLGAVTARHCYFGGGTVSINAVDADVVGSTVHLIDNLFWNDMLNGPGSRSTNPAVKGFAVLANSTITFGTFTGNAWAPEVGGGAVGITRL